VPVGLVLNEMLFCFGLKLSLQLEYYFILGLQFFLHGPKDFLTERGTGHFLPEFNKVGLIDPNLLILLLEFSLELEGSGLLYLFGFLLELQGE
jgi:hypothetical protein